jgi:REP element-mobilizing transposase RayT
MPRLGRVVLPNYPHHIVQRGHNRQVVFAAEHDFKYYLETLSEWRSIYEVRIYAWCLMTNHIHLIVEPPENVARLGQLMKRLSGRQTRYVNRLEGRSGTLWESRYKSSPIQTDELIQEAIARGQLTGNSRYIEEVEKIIGRRIEHRRPGRPRATKNEKNKSVPFCC